MALFLALVVWFYINQEYTDKLGPIDVPLKLEASSYVIGEIRDVNNQPVKTVRVELEGPRGVLKEKPADIICRHKVIVTGMVEETFRQPEQIRESDFNLPPSIKVKNITPSQIWVQLMKEEEKYLRVKSTGCTEGEPAKGYEITEVKAEPSEILVHGPKHILDKLSEIPTKPLDVSGATASFSRPGDIVETVEGLQVSTSDAFRIIVNIAEKPEEIILKDVEVKILQPSDFPYLVNTKPKQLDLKFKVPKGRKIEKGQVELFVNVGKLYSEQKDIKPGSFPGVQVEFNLPPDIILAEPIKPVTIEISELPKPPPPPLPGP